MGIALLLQFSVENSGRPAMAGVCWNLLQKGTTRHPKFLERFRVAFPHMREQLVRHQKRLWCVAIFQWYLGGVQRWQWAFLFEMVQQIFAHFVCCVHLKFRSQPRIAGLVVPGHTHCSPYLHMPFLRFVAPVALMLYPRPTAPPLAGCILLLLGRTLFKTISFPASIIRPADSNGFDTSVTVRHWNSFKFLRQSTFRHIF